MLLRKIKPIFITYTLEASIIYNAPFQANFLEMIISNLNRNSNNFDESWNIWTLEQAMLCWNPRICCHVLDSQTWFTLHKPH